MKKALLGFSVAVLALTGCSKFEAKKTDVTKGDLNEKIMGTWVETTCKDSTRQLLDFSKDASGADVVTVVLLKFAEGDKDCTAVQSGEVIAKNTHNLKVKKYKSDYAAGKVQVGEDKEELETSVVGERLHLGKKVYARVDRSNFSGIFGDDGKGAAPADETSGKPTEQPVALKDASKIIIEELDLENEAIIEMEEIVVEAKKMTEEEKFQYDLEQTIQGLQLPAVDTTEQENLAAKSN